MTDAVTIGIAIYLIGIAVAWLQIRYWNRENRFKFPRDYVILTLMSILSWLVYPIWAVEWVKDEMNL